MILGIIIITAAMRFEVYWVQPVPTLPINPMRPHSIILQTQIFNHHMVLVFHLRQPLKWEMLLFSGIQATQVLIWDMLVFI